MLEVTRRCEQGEGVEREEYAIKGQNKDCEDVKVVKKKICEEER
jgi:hypothetical protein